LNALNGLNDLNSVSLNERSHLWQTNLALLWVYRIIPAAAR
jgi:hypothetical protein